MGSFPLFCDGVEGCSTCSIRHSISTYRWSLLAAVLQALVVLDSGVASAGTCWHYLPLLPLIPPPAPGTMHIPTLGSQDLDVNELGGSVTWGFLEEKMKDFGCWCWSLTEESTHSWVIQEALLITPTTPKWFSKKYGQSNAWIPMSIPPWFMDRNHTIVQLNTRVISNMANKTANNGC